MVGAGKGFPGVVGSLCIALLGGCLPDAQQEARFRATQVSRLGSFA